jgi:hypothetical protein
MADYSQELLAAARPFWEAEAEIASRFFKGNPSKNDHLYWLRAQLWKELHPVDGYFSGIQQELMNLVEMFPKIDKDVNRHRFAFLLQQMLEEFNHYVLFADIFEFIAERQIDLSVDLVQLPQEKKLQELRRRYATSDSAMDKAAVLFTEGGGAMLFREGAKVKGGKAEKMIADAMQVIYDDEKDHFLEGAKESAELIHSKEDAERMKAAIADVSRQRVAMRLEMFRYPMTEEQTKQFIRAA